MDEIRAIAENGEIRTILYLIRNGIPFDVAFSLPQNELMAWSIIFGELDGNKWDWNNNRWTPND